MSEEAVDKKQENQEQTPRWKKVLNIILDVLFALFVVLAIFMVVGHVSAKKNEGTIPVFNSQLRLVETGSMAENKNYSKEEYKSFKIKNLPIDTLISVDDITKKSYEKRDDFYATLKRGDVLTFKYPVNGLVTVVTHRVTDVEKLPDRNFYKDDHITLDYSRPNYKITLKGDAVEGEGESVYQYIETAKDEEDPMCYVIGEVKWSSLSTGKFTRFISSKWGIVVLVIVPCATLLIYEVSKIVLILVKNKKEKEALETGAKDAELEELRKKVKELESKPSEEKAEKVEEEK